MRRFCLLFAVVFGCALAAETVGNVEFHFPATTNEWVLLTDSSAYPNSIEFPMPITVKMYTHKTGDALEFFTAAYVIDDEDDDDEEDAEEPFQTAEFTQMFLNDVIKPYFPNHQITITRLTETGDEGFAEWELTDGVQVILHGLCRALAPNGNSVLLGYMTTAAKSAVNTDLWSATLLEARFMGQAIEDVLDELDDEYSE
jgi:hypothetical protein